MGRQILSLAFFTPQLRPGSQGTKAGPRFWSQIPTFGGCGSFLFSAYCSKSEPGLNLTGLCSVPAASPFCPQLYDWAVTALPWASLASSVAWERALWL